VVQLQIVDCRPSLDIHGVSRSDRLEVCRGDDIKDAGPIPEPWTILARICWNPDTLLPNRVQHCSGSDHGKKTQSSCKYCPVF